MVLEKVLPKIIEHKKSVFEEEIFLHESKSPEKRPRY